MSFRAPVEDIAFWLRRVAGLDEDLAAGTFPDLSGDVLDAVLGEAGRFATDEIAPLNQPGDREGAHFSGGAVTMPAGWCDAYARWSEAGWPALTGPAAFGGQGLPAMLHAATLEMWNAASTAFATGPMLTFGAVEALERHGTDEQKALYLPHLVSGRWTGTMNLTEPQAGSDLAALRTRAEPAGDGSFRITGTKIFITYGEHDLTENIVHMVLARLPDAPAGTRGISLFLVPKFIPDADGRPGRRNALAAASIEHKLGLHASPTCVMQFEGATGWLVGEPHRGLAAMFTMMNNARLAVAVQGVGTAERAVQRAFAFAMERRQGRAPGWTGDDMSPIVLHPDVQRMLLTMRGLTDAARALCFALAREIDLSRHAPPEHRAAHANLAALITPVAKGFATDVGIAVSSLGIQVHGGMGFIEETGAAQHLRDARVLAIYEGTNGIQAIDLVTRKLPLESGTVADRWIADLRRPVARALEAGDDDLSALALQVESALDHAEGAARHLVTIQAEGRTRDALAGATAFAELLGLAAGGGYHLAAVMADRDAGTGSPAAARRRLVARFYGSDLLPKGGALAAAATAGAAVLDAFDPALFST